MSVIFSPPSPIIDRPPPLCPASPPSPLSSAWVQGCWTRVPFHTVQNYHPTTQAVSWSNTRESNLLGTTQVPGKRPPSPQPNPESKISPLFVWYKKNVTDDRELRFSSRTGHFIHHEAVPDYSVFFFNRQEKKKESRDPLFCVRFEFRCEFSCLFPAGRFIRYFVSGKGAKVVAQ